MSLQSCNMQTNEFLVNCFSLIVIGMQSTSSELTVTCPECGHEFQLSPAVLSGLREQVQADVKASHDKERAALSSQLDSYKSKEADLKALDERLKSQADKIDETVESRLKAKESELSRKAEAKARENLDLQLKELANDRDEKAKELKAAQAKELEFLREKRKLEEAKEQFELSVQKKIEEERKQIQEAAAKKAEEDQARKLSEKDRIVEGLRKQIDDLRRKADQGSQQLQGESLELDLEDALRESFPADELNDVPKGVRGVDLVLGVRSPTGRKAGSIAIEIKQRKSWSDAWIHKLKEDQRLIAADIGMIVTSVLPKDIKRFGQKDGVWICDIASFIALSSALRWSLIQTHGQRVANENRDSKMEVLFNYITGTEFRQKVEALLESFELMRSDLERERKVFQKAWSNREKSIEQAVRSTAGLFGDVQSLSGGSVAAIESLELESIAAG